MFAFLRATQKLGLMAGPETRLSVRMLSRTAPAGNEAMPLPTHDKVELISIDRKGRLLLLLCTQVYPEKIVTIVDQISGLNLLEVADLNALLKSKLNISDAPVMMAGASAPAPAAAAPVEVCCYAWYLTPAELRALLCLAFYMDKGYRKFQFLKPQGQV